VSALNANSLNGSSINPEALALAYASLRSVAAGQAPDKRFDWTTLRRGPKFADAYLREQLMQTFSTESRERRSEFEDLNPIQRQMLSEIAKRVGVFGSDIVTDKAIAEWEKTKVGHIKEVLAAVVSLGSELDPNFIQSITAISQSDEFSKWRYLIATDDEASFKSARKAFHEALESNAPARLRAKVRSKFITNRITIEQFRELGKSIEHEGVGWDALYLYKVKTGPDLLIGVFRRCPPVPAEMPATTTEQWGCTPINEALRWSSVSDFDRAHKKLWDEVDGRQS
jgi:hypothetical protein